MYRRNLEFFFSKIITFILFFMDYTKLTDNFNNKNVCEA